MKKIAFLICYEDYKKYKVFALELAKQIRLYGKRAGEDLEPVFALPQSIGKSERPTELADLAETGFQVRDSHWKIVPSSDAAAIASFYPVMGLDKRISEYCVPSDGANNFLDCDAWILFGDHIPTQLLPIRRYFFASLGYPNRYAPELFADPSEWEKFRSVGVFAARSATRIFTLTQAAKSEISSFAGVKPDQIIVLDHLLRGAVTPWLKNHDGHVFDPFFVVWRQKSDFCLEDDTFFGLTRYYEQFGGAFDFLPYRDYSSTPSLQDAGPTGAVGQVIQGNLLSTGFFHNVSDRVVCLSRSQEGSEKKDTQAPFDRHIWQQAKFIWVPEVLEAYLSLVVLARQAGVSILSPATPILVELCSQLNVRLFPCPINSPIGMARELKKMEEQATQLSITNESNQIDLAVSQKDGLGRVIKLLMG